MAAVLMLFLLPVIFMLLGVPCGYKHGRAVGRGNAKAATWWGRLLVALWVLAAVGDRLLGLWLAEDVAAVSVVFWLSIRWEL
jgi:hypothetical protein